MSGRSAIASLLILAIAAVGEAQDQPKESTRRGQDQLAQAEREFFEKRIRPVFVEHCYECHSDDDAGGNLRLDSKLGWSRGGDSGPALVPGDPASSLLFRAVEYEDDRLKMPPDDAAGKLEPQQIRDIAAWIRRGAFDPRTDAAASRSTHNAASEHWAFQPIRSLQLPDDAQHPIDHWIDHQLAKAKFRSVGAADLRTLVRRAVYDLHGLPPSADQLQTKSSDFPQLIDSLLESPRYGEHWGRHWLDVARYSDAKDGVLMYGDARIRPFAYTYRDYVIRAFNDDKPFDQFIREQLAADQLPLAPDAPELAAMGLLTLGRLFDRNRHDVIDDQIDVVTRAFLGLTVSCARCHDHKFDPVPTTDYYSLYGVFASSIEPLRRPRIENVKETGEGFESEMQKTIDQIMQQREAHYREQLETARRRTTDYLVEVATTKPDITETSFFFLSLTPDQLRPRITNRWRQLIARRAHSDDTVFGPWSDLMERMELQVERWRERGVDERIVQALCDAKPKTPKQVAEVYGTVLVNLWGRESDIRARLARLETRRAALSRGFLDLADMVGGGDGLGSGTVGAGIHPSTGQTTTGDAQFVEVARPNQWIETPDHPFIDGVFTPAGGDCIIASTELKISGLPTTKGQTWDYLKNGPTSGAQLNLIGDTDYAQPPHRVISMHANKGVTFDLQALRRTHGFSSAELHAVAGNSGEKGHHLDVQVYLDGQLEFEHKNLAARGPGAKIRIDLPPNSRFLSLVTLEGKQGISHDQALFGNPRIVPTSAAQWRRRQASRLAQLHRQSAELHDELATLPTTQSDPLVELLTSQDSPTWFPIENTEYYLSRTKRDAYRGLLNRLDTIAVRHPDAAARAMVLTDAQRLTDPVVFMRGQPSLRGAPVPRRFLTALTSSNQPFANGSGRLELADAIASRRNPLTARVWANRIWLHHFGEPLVDTPSDFGLRTARPRHHQLLDYLASRLIANGWRTKPLHRLIMTSRAYQRRSSIPATAPYSQQADADPTNSLLWRMNRRRLSLEQMRDTLLAASGQLDLSMYGRPQIITDTKNRRRTIYSFVERQNLPNVVQTFDAANADTSTARRVMTTVPQQALFAMNSDFMMQAAEALAERTKAQAGAARVEQIYLAALRRSPTESETELALKFVAEQPWAHFAQVLLMSNELMFVD